MSDMEIWGCPDRLRSAGQESAEHLWGKVALEQRKRENQAPYFPGEYRFETTVADLVPDCLIWGDTVNRWIEIVGESNQLYRRKTREALRLGFVIHWVFSSEHENQRQTARQALGCELDESVEFGTYDVQGGELELGTPVNFKNFDYPVESMTDFSPTEIRGYRAGAARVGRLGGGFDLGEFEIAGCQRRVVSNRYGTYFRAPAPNQRVEEVPWGWPTQEGLKRLVEAGQVRRLGPVGRDV